MVTTLCCKQCKEWARGKDSDGNKHRLGEDYGTCRVRVKWAVENPFARIQPRYTTHADDVCVEQWRR